MAKDKKNDAVERFMDRRKLAKAKSENLKVIPTKQKAKKIKRTGKCSPGKVLRGNKCVPRIEGAVKKKRRISDAEKVGTAFLDMASYGIYSTLRYPKKKKKK